MLNMKIEQETRLCHVKGKKCLFHKWCDRGKFAYVDGLPGGFVRETFAIVENEWGEVFEASPTEVRFADDRCKLSWVTEVHVNETQTEIQKCQG